MSDTPFFKTDPEAVIILITTGVAFAINSDNSSNLCTTYVAV